MRAEGGVRLVLRMCCFVAVRAPGDRIPRAPLDREPRPLGVCGMLKRGAENLNLSLVTIVIFGLDYVRSVLKVRISTYSTAKCLFVCSQIKERLYHPDMLFGHSPQQWSLLMTEPTQLRVRRDDIILNQ